MKKYKKKPKPAPQARPAAAPQPRAADSGQLSRPQLMEQQRAAYALRKVQAAVGDEGCKNSEFKAYARRLPAMIQTNGLGQAAAFFRSKGVKNPAYQALYALLSEWLTGPSRPYDAFGDLLDGVTGADMHRYRQAQAEAQALLAWVKKFAEALCPNDEEAAP